MGGGQELFILPAPFYSMILSLPLGLPLLCFCYHKIFMAPGIFLSCMLFKSFDNKLTFPTDLKHFLVSRYIL